MTPPQTHVLADGSGATVNDASVYKGGSKYGRADNGDTEEKTGKHNNQTGKGVGADADNARMLLLQITAASNVDHGSIGNVNMGKHTMDNGG
jgi:hypothetical protein